MPGFDCSGRGKIYNAFDRWIGAAALAGGLVSITFYPVPAAIKRAVPEQSNGVPAEFRRYG